MNDGKSEIQEIGWMLVDMQRMMDLCDEHGPEFDQLQGRLSRAIERFKAFPRKVADQGPFPTAADAQVVLTRECAFIIAAVDGTN
jgi:hypothetical protein